MGIEDIFDLGKPSVPVKAHHNAPSQSQRGQDQLLQDLGELKIILSETERLKRIAKAPEDWRVIMLYIAGQKPRISETASRAKRIYATEFGDAYDAQYAGEGKGPAAKTAEIRAKRDAGLAYEVAERFDRTWRDLQDLMWSVKSVADAMDAERGSPTFDAYPDHMFPQGAQPAEPTADAVDTEVDEMPERVIPPAPTTSPF